MAFVVVVRVAKRPLRTYRIMATVAFVLSIIPNIVSAVKPAAALCPVQLDASGGYAAVTINSLPAHLELAMIETELAVGAVDGDGNDETAAHAGSVGWLDENFMAGRQWVNQNRAIGQIANALFGADGVFAQL